MSKSTNYDVIVIGGGPAGYVSAIKAAMLGGQVALIEQDTLGGTCLNRGCIPTKAYLKTAELLHEISGAANRGVMLDTASVSIDMKIVKSSKDRVVKKLTAGVGQLLKSHGVMVYKSQAIIQDASFRIALDDSQSLSAKSVIFAGGSVPVMPSFLADLPAGCVLDSTSILELTEVPKRLGILGGGVIGIEMARAFKAFGSEVTIIEALDRLAPFLDEELSAVLQDDLKQQGIVAQTGVKLQSATAGDSGVLLELENDESIEVDALLVSVGRKPDLSALGKLDVATDNGKVRVNDHMETSVPNLYAPGDVNGQCMLAHAAFKMGEAAAANALGHAASYDGQFVPSVIYGHPEIASVGLTEQQARQQCPNLAVGKFPFAANGRALASGLPEGFVKVLVDPTHGEILGVHMAGVGASELINEAAALMTQEITAHELAEQVHAHPTCAEALMEAAADALGHCLHLPRQKK